MAFWLPASSLQNSDTINICLHLPSLWYFVMMARVTKTPNLWWVPTQQGRLSWTHLCWTQQLQASRTFTPAFSLLACHSSSHTSSAGEKWGATCHGQGASVSVVQDKISSTGFSLWKSFAIVMCKATAPAWKPKTTWSSVNPHDQYLDVSVDFRP